MDILYIIFEISVKLPFLWACKNIQVFILKIDLILYRNTLKCTQTPAQRTVFLATKKATVNKINYLYILSSPLENKFYTDCENKNISEGCQVFCFVCDTSGDGSKGPQKPKKLTAFFEKFLKKPKCTGCMFQK